jgi:hypothetical protein
MRRQQVEGHFSYKLNIQDVGLLIGVDAHDLLVVLAAGAEDAALTVAQPKGGGLSWTLWGSVAGGVAAVLVLSGAAIWWFRRQASST